MHLCSWPLYCLTVSISFITLDLANGDVQFVIKISGTVLHHCLLFSTLKVFNLGYLNTYLPHFVNSLFEIMQIFRITMVNIIIYYICDKISLVCQVEPYCCVCRSEACQHFHIFNIIIKFKGLLVCHFCHSVIIMILL